MAVMQVSAAVHTDTGNSRLKVRCVDTGNECWRKESIEEEEIECKSENATGKKRQMERR